MFLSVISLIALIGSIAYGIILMFTEEFLVGLGFLLVVPPVIALIISALLWLADLLEPYSHRNEKLAHRNEE